MAACYTPKIIITLNPKERIALCSALMRTSGKNPFSLVAQETGVGTKIEFVDDGDNEEIDITDYSSW